MYVHAHPKCDRYIISVECTSHDMYIGTEQEWSSKPDYWPGYGRGP